MKQLGVENFLLVTYNGLGIEREYYGSTQDGEELFYRLTFSRLRIQDRYRTYADKRCNFLTKYIITMSILYRLNEQNYSVKSFN